ncbi:hypothetical protein N7474_009494 [Penicillium riverlandense]|uniref:uncharacterized protein n=1 Tax=Penicillium riverlandense TaxID=1903569 RepID=UPI0025482B35|nr:uncharacterized protein N7474_009494 [Penicillium riverlandense]KAJ5808225.1 hypothetical protein N7474_009494 [Penicillium riverlandense]
MDSAYLNFSSLDSIYIIDYVVVTRPDSYGSLPTNRKVSLSGLFYTLTHGQRVNAMKGRHVA